MFNTGTVSWYYRCVLEGLVGFRGHINGVSIQPCLPSNWDRLSARRKFREADFNIEIKRGSQKAIVVNGKPLSGYNITNIKPGYHYDVQVMI